MVDYSQIIDIKMELLLHNLHYNELWLMKVNLLTLNLNYFYTHL